MQAERRKKIVHTTEYLLPRNAVVGEVLKAVRAAWAEWCSLTGKSADTNMPDHWAVMDATDEHLILRFSFEKAGE